MRSEKRLRLEGQLAISAQATRPGCVNASPRRRRRCPNLLKMLAGEIPYSPSLPQHPQEESMAASSRVKKRLLNIFDGPVDILLAATNGLSDLKPQTCMHLRFPKTNCCRLEGGWKHSKPGWRTRTSWSHQVKDAKQPTNARGANSLWLPNHSSQSGACTSTKTIFCRNHCASASFMAASS